MKKILQDDDARRAKLRTRKNPVAKALRVNRRQVINSKKLYKREKFNAEQY